MIWFAPETWPFGASLALMLALLVVEGIGLMLSISTSEWLDSIIPDSVDTAFGWLHLGTVPLLVLLGLLLAGFSLGGYAVQSIAKAITGDLLPAWVACVPAFFVGMSSVSVLGGLLAKIIPSDETSAVSELSLIGRAGVVTQGIARSGHAAQAKVRDQHGRPHYVMVEPDIDGQEFVEGSAVLLVKKAGARYHAIANPHPELL